MVGEERLNVAGRPLPTLHLRIDPAEGGSRDVWVDGDGRLLRISLPGRNLVAMRDEAPP